MGAGGRFFAIAGAGPRLLWTNHIHLWEIIALSTLQGLLNALEMPARQSFLVQIIDDRADLSNAIALNSSINSGARLIGPAIAGFVIAGFGEGMCFLADGISYLAVIASLLMMRIQREAAQRHAKTMLEQMREGWDYVCSVDAVRSLLILFALTSLMGYPSMVLLPIFADAGAAWRRAYTWVALRGGRVRHADGGLFPGGEEVCRGACARRAGERVCHQHLTCFLWALALACNFPADDGVRGVRPDAVRFRH